MKGLIGILIFFFSLPLLAQPYGNEWINYNQSYYKIPIAEEGIYRISYQSLINSGVPINTFNPQSLQLFARGEEIPIYVEGEQDGVFNPNDFIEFYARPNDGWLDSVFYKGRSNQPNPYYSLINDTIHYFLSWNNSGQSVRRLQIENATDFGNYFPAAFIWKESISVYSNVYYDGEILPSQATDPEYVASEGYMSNVLRLGDSRVLGIATPNRYSAGPFVDFEMKIVGQSNWSGQNNGDHHIEVQVGNQTVSRIFEGYSSVDLNLSFSPSEIIGGNNLVRLRSIDDRNSGVDRTAVPYMKITYPHTMSFSNAESSSFMVDDHSIQSKQYLEILFFRGGNQPVLYDLTNGKRILVIQGTNDYKTLIPNGGGRKRCFISSSSAIKNVSNLKAVGVNGRFTNYLSQVVDTTFLIVTQNSLINEASRYAAYRRSTAKGALVVKVGELYDQFGFGVEKNPLSIRNFVEHAVDLAPFPISHLFLVGKSVSAKAHRNNATAYAENLVPTFGNPAADNLLTSGLNQSGLAPLVPQGRLSALNNADISAYLTKVIAYENTPDAAWRKRALHFAGGKRALEANQLESYLNGFALDYQAPPKGGEVKTFRKSSSAPFQTSLSDSIRTLINNGVGLMTFFGHASATGNFDITIDSPDQLSNLGKYPFVLANSCYAGNYHQAGIRSTAEDYVLEPNKGAIGFIANGNLGLANTLNDYSGTFYEHFCRKGYGKSMAENMLEAVKELDDNNMYPSLKGICLEMSLQGDPSIAMFAPQLPDYSTSIEQLSILPAELTTDLDSFTIAINILNKGKAIADSLSLELRHDFPAAQSVDSIYFYRIKPVYFEERLEIRLPISIQQNVGNNQFTLLLDPLNEVAELSETNNRLDFDVLVRSGEIIPVSPSKFSIVGEQGVTLKASTAFAFEGEKQYRFELDTNGFFNSPFKQVYELSSIGGVVEWSPNVLSNMPDSAVYFWRVSPVVTNPADYKWRASSFQYINQQSGWSQDHFDQYLNNPNVFIEANSTQKEFSYTAGARELRVTNLGNPQNQKDHLDILYAIDADIRERGACRIIKGFLVAVLDSLTLDAWQTPYNGQFPQNDFGQANVDNWCSPFRERSESYFLFRSDSLSEMRAMRDMILNRVPDGHYIVIYNWLPLAYSQIRNQDSTVLKAIETLGSTEISNLQDNYPFIFTVKKGDISSVQELAGDSANARITLRRDIPVSAVFGEYRSPLIGPSLDWKKLSYHFRPQETNSADSLIVVLLGVDENGNENLLFRSNRSFMDTAIANIADASQYPNLRLKAATYDEQNRTAPQLLRWELSHREVPDLALNPQRFFSISSDTLQAGEKLRFTVAITNLGSSLLDSFTVDLSILNNNNQLSQLKQEKIAALPADSSMRYTAEVNTKNLSGLQTLIIELNSKRDLLELNYFNNQGEFNFFVTQDRLNPLLDVTFDGKRIINREIVSAEPEIRIRLDDENQFLAIDDTSSVRLFIRDPQGQESLLNYQNSAELLQFIPASLPDNQAQVVYRPSFKQDGIYQLRVQAFDKSGNATAQDDFVVEFEVITKSSVTHLLNYPNPFSTSTRFVFTLTGSKVPDQIQIQIMTVTGKVVKEIDQYELGPIRIGNNISTYAWDGKDEFGDQLANGVYLYRVKMRINGVDVERRESAVDDFFKEDFGKMYLLR